MNKTRLQIEPLEQREVPANLFGGNLQMMGQAAMLPGLMRDFDWMSSSIARPYVQSFFSGLYQSSMSTGNSPGGSPMAGLAAFVGNSLGFAVTPPPSAPIVHAPKPTDAGMVNTMPSPTDSHWVALGSQGLKTWDVVTGTGTPVTAGKHIVVFYTGWLASNGTKFDSRRSPSPPVDFSLTGLIQGWQQGIVGMKPGGIRRLLVPSALGYGVAGSPPNIPANAELVFEIKLISSHT
jgi:hypothetical protein